jgi:hypothetical protein
MHEAFRQYVESMHPAFERLTAMAPVTIKDAPLQCIYLFSEISASVCGNTPFRFSTQSSRVRGSGLHARLPADW